MLGESILELHFVCIGGASDRDVHSIGKMKHVIDGANRAKLDGPVAEPVENSARELVVAEQAAVMQSNVPRESIPGECVREPADRLRLFQQQYFVIHARKGGCRRHTAHTRADDNDVKSVVVCSILHTNASRFTRWQRDQHRELCILFRAPLPRV